jgi:hypothetical protein
MQGLDEVILQQPVARIPAISSAAGVPIFRHTQRGTMSTVDKAHQLATEDGNGGTGRAGKMA